MPPSELPDTLTLRYCEGCGRHGRSRAELADAHNPSWPDASPIVCVGPITEVVYVPRAAKASPVIPAPKATPCPRCEGDSHLNTIDGPAPCPNCHGTGVAEVKDLRGLEHRSVHRDDVVIITGAEYLRKSRLAGEAEAARQENALYGEPVAEVTPTAPSRQVRWSPQALADLAAIVHSSEPVAEVIPVAVLRDLRAWIAKSQALPALRSLDFEAGRQLAFKAVVRWLDEHTREEPRP